MLEIINTTKQKINSKRVAAIAESVLKFYKKERAEVSIVIIGDAKMRSLNRDFRGFDKTTDVLSFSPAGQSSALPLKKGAPLFLGEIFINIQEAGRASKYKEMLNGLKSCDYIVYFLLVHGILHLIGYDDKTEKGRLAMIELGQKFLDRFFAKKVL